MIQELQDALHIDLETRSTVNLRQTGPFVYAQHWSTEVWCACYARGDGLVDSWHPGDPPPPLVVQAAEEGTPFVAHNAGFERVHFKHILGPRHGWPVPPLQQWWCTASMAAAIALPRALEGALTVMGDVQQKDMEGNKLIRLMMKPYRTEKVQCWLCGQKTCEHHESFKLRLHYHETPEQIARGTLYCERDVEGERALCHRIRPLPPAERKVWLLNELMNERGVRVDLPAVKSAQVIVQKSMKDLNENERLLTGAEKIGDELIGGYAATQVAKLKWWCNFEGVNLSDLRKDTLRDILLDNKTLDETVRQALELRQEAAKTSTSKLNAFERRTCDDGRMRDNCMYHGASTGRFSGRGAQLQNLPSRFTLTTGQKLIGAQGIHQGMSPEELKRVVHWTGLFDGVKDPVSSPLEVVSSALRGLIVADGGSEFTVGDFNAIECRGEVWLAGADGLLGVFLRKEDPYLYQAAGIYDYVDLSWVDWSDPKSVDEAKRRYARERALGKIAVLGLGYQMGPDKFVTTCWKERIAVSLPEAIGVVKGYRETNYQIPELWEGMEDAAFEAVRNPDRVVSVAAAGDRIKFARRGTWLYMQLPSGRLLSYAHPAIKRKKMPWFDKDGNDVYRWGVTYWGVESTTHRWLEQSGYGGKWVENAVQALCRDLLVEAMLRLEGAGYWQVLSVHDESVSEHPTGFGSPEEFKRLMCIVPDWAQGLPVEAEVWRGVRYRK